MFYVPLDLLVHIISFFYTHFILFDFDNVAGSLAASSFLTLDLIYLPIVLLDPSMLKDHIVKLVALDGPGVMKTSWAIVRVQCV